MALILDFISFGLVIFLYLLFRIAKERKAGKKFSDLRNLTVSLVAIVVLLWTISFIHGFCSGDDRVCAKPMPKVVSDKACTKPTPAVVERE